MDVMQDARNVPPPEGRRVGPRSPAARKILSLKVGQSLTGPLSLRPLFSVQASVWGVKTGRQFKTRKIDNLKFRLWRVA